MDLVRTLDEYRELTTGADFKRMSSQMLEFSRIHDHVHALERWLHGEHSKIKRILQSVQTDNESRFQVVISECAAMLRLLSGVVQQQDDDWRVHWGMIHDAVAEVVAHVQRKVFALEEVVPMEVKARQTQDEKLRKRMDAVVKSLSRALEVTRDDALAAVAASKASGSSALTLPSPDQTAAVVLQRRVDALEEAHAQAMRRIDEQLEQVGAVISKDARSTVGGVPQDTPQRFTTIPSSSGRPAATDASVETEVVDWGAIVKQQSSELLQPFVDELSERQNELLSRLETLESMVRGDAVASLQRWSATHAQECRQCYEYLQWTLDQALTELAVRQTLDTLVDDVRWKTLGSPED
jgi:hypothetical protein